jgi:hypothetical protein
LWFWNNEGARRQIAKVHFDLLGLAGFTIISDALMREIRSDESDCRADPRTNRYSFE